MIFQGFAWILLIECTELNVLNSYIYMSCSCIRIVQNEILLNLNFTGFQLHIQCHHFVCLYMHKSCKSATNFWDSWVKFSSIADTDCLLFSQSTPLIESILFKKYYVMIYVHIHDTWSYTFIFYSDNDHCEKDHLLPATTEQVLDTSDLLFWII